MNEREKRSEWDTRVLCCRSTREVTFVFSLTLFDCVITCEYCVTLRRTTNSCFFSRDSRALQYTSWIRYDTHPILFQRDSIQRSLPHRLFAYLNRNAAVAPHTETKIRTYFKI
jgi:hypothetical protein